MAIFARNCQPVAVFPGTTMWVWFIREALLAAGWSENSNDGDPAWSSSLNLVLNAVSGVNGLNVSAASPRLVVSPNGDFLSSHVGLTLNLDAANDRNRGLHRISRYIDANTVEVDIAGWFPDVGWADESDIDGRVTTAGGVSLSNGAWTIMDSPAGYNVQVRIVFQDTSNAFVYVRPRGKLADLTEIATGNMGGYYGTRARFNLYADGVQVALLWPAYYSNSGQHHTSGLVIGSLLDADAADTDPVFLMWSNAGFDNLHLNDISMEMLDSTLAPISAYPASTLKPDKDGSPGTTLMDRYRVFNRRLLGSAGLASMRSPWVCLANVVSAGACVRGRLPIFRHTYTGFEKFTPMDAAGNWQHFHNGMVIPRNGPQDPLIMQASTSL